MSELSLVTNNYKIASAKNLVDIASNEVSNGLYIFTAKPSNSLDNKVEVSTNSPAELVAAYREMIFGKKVSANEIWVEYKLVYKFLKYLCF